MRYNRSHKPRLTDGCLFVSGHQGPTVDTFERFASRAGVLLSVVIRSLRFTLDWQGTCQLRSTVTAGVIVSPWYWPATLNTVVRIGGRA
jgi:hypothetical protein